MPPPEECPKCKPGVPAWVVTFSDLMTLLLTFFVLLLSMSETTVIKYERAAESLHRAFAGFNVIGQPVVSVVEIPELKPTHKKVRVVENEEAERKELTNTKEKDYDFERRVQVIQAIDQIVKEELKKEMDMGFAEIKSNQQKVLIRFPSDVFFESGSDQLNKKMKPVVEKLATSLNGFQIKSVISGHTDSVPIKTRLFRSNWDLSARRAASIAQVFGDKGDFPSSRMEIHGFADGRPIADNTSPENRSKNRRVEVEIEPSDAEFTDDVFQNIIDNTIGTSDKKEEINVEEKIDESVQEKDSPVLDSTELRPSKIQKMIDRIKAFSGKNKPKAKESEKDTTKKE